MQKNGILRMVFVPLLCLILMLSSFGFGAVAAENVDFSIAIKQYNEETMEYESVNMIRPGKSVYVIVSVKGASKLGAMALSVAYNASLYTFNEARSYANTSDDNAVAMFYAAGTDANGKVNVTWDTTSKQTSSNGEMIYLSFTAASVSEEKITTEFTLSVNQLFDSNYNVINHTTSVPTATLTLIKTDISSTYLDAFAALETITSDSKQDIDKALGYWNAMTSQQQLALYTYYRNYYEYLNTALTRYYAVLESMGMEVYQKELDNFLAEYTEIINLDATEVTLSDEDRIKKMLTSYQTLTSAAISLMDGTTKNKIATLKKAIDDLKADIEEEEEARDEYAAFKSDEQQFSIIWLPTVLQNISNTYDFYGDYLALALANYDMLSSAAKRLAADDYDYLMRVKAAIDECLAKDEAEKELSEKSTAFLNQYVYAFTRNAANVEIGDKSAIKIALEAYNELDDEQLKVRLATKVEVLEELLETIADMESMQSKPIVIPDENLGSEPVVTPNENSGPVETITITNTITNTISEKVPVEKYKTVTNTVTRTINNMLSNTNKLVLYLVCILVVAMGALSYAIIMFILARKRNAKIASVWDTSL